MPFNWLIDDVSESVLLSLGDDLSAGAQPFAAFVGAGLSKQAGMPLWTEWLKLMDDEVQKYQRRPQHVRAAVLNHTDLLWQAEVFRLELERRAAYQRLLRKTFTKRAPAANRGAIDNLVRLGFRHFLTTNYDTFLQQSLGDQNLQVDEFDWTNRAECRDFFLRYLSGGAKSVIHLHGRGDQPSSIILSHRDYVARYVETSEYVEKLSVLFATLRIVFVGFSLEDPDLRFILRQVNSRFGAGDVQHYALLGFSRSNEGMVSIERARLERQFGIAPIFYDDANGHAALADALAALSAPKVPTQSKQSTVKSAPAIDWNADPNKDAFGGSPADAAGTRRLIAETIPGAEPFKEGHRFALNLIVETTGGSPLTGPVTFHLHPTFPQPTMEVPAHNGKAVLSLKAFGAFTVGVVCDNGATRLELDLAAVPTLPPDFRKL
jgi:hypothetical protein